MPDSTIDNFDDFSEKAVQYLTYIGVQLLFLLNFINTHMKIQYENLYKDNDFFHKCVDKMDENLYYMKSLSVPYRIEPPYSYFKVCYKDQTYKEEYLNVDTILYETKTTPAILSNLVSNYKTIFSLIKPIVKHNELEYLVLLHYRNMTDDYIISRLIDECENQDDDEYNVVCDVKPTRNYFLSVEYEHPDMDTKIILDIDKKYLISGNELFSPCFVLKCLNYQSESYKFDQNYKLNILDADINNIVLTNKQYLRLSNTKYEVIQLKTNNKTD